MDDRGADHSACACTAVYTVPAVRCRGHGDERDQKQYGPRVVRGLPDAASAYTLGGKLWADGSDVGSAGDHVTADLIKRSIQDQDNELEGFELSD